MENQSVKLIEYKKQLVKEEDLNQNNLMLKE